MFERFFAFVSRHAPSSDGDSVDADDPRIAAAALMLRIADADGERIAGEMAGLRAGLVKTFGMSAEEARRLIAAGEVAGNQAVDLLNLTEVLQRGLDEAGRRAFVACLIEMTRADGASSELEDVLVWRVGTLLGLDDAAIAALREARSAPSA